MLMKALLAGLLLFVFLFLLRTDFWLWHNSSLVLGLPVGLLYHVGYCFVVSAAMLYLIRRFWPGHLDQE